MKKFSGKLSSLSMLYDISNTSNTGKDPKPLGKDFSLFMPRFKILNLDIPDKDTGTSVNELLNKFKISMFSRLAMAGGNSEILLWLKVSLVMFLMFQSLAISSIWTKLLSLKSISAFGTPWASSKVFLTILDVILKARCACLWCDHEETAACQGYISHIWVLASWAIKERVFFGTYDRSRLLQSHNAFIILLSSMKIYFWWSCSWN